MPKNQNLYKYLYDTLVSQFISGVFYPGQEFLSQREICSHYNVGITTVRKVMKMLEEGGYIRTSRGKPSVVAYHASAEACAAHLAGHREEIADVYSGFQLIMPVLYKEGAKLCKEPELRLLREITKTLSDNMSQAELYAQANAFFATLVKPFSNRLIMDLALDAENYFHIPYIALPDMKNPFTLTAGKLKAWFTNAITLIEEENFEAFGANIADFYRSAASMVDQYLCSLGKYACAFPKQKVHSVWFRARGRSELYSRLALALARRIVSGEFQGQKYLPSIPKLMEEYGVMKDTACRALALLNSLGIVQTLDKRGTVLSQSAGPVESSVDFEDPAVRERLLLLLEALQVISLTIGSCASRLSPMTERLTKAIDQSLPGEFLTPLSVQALIYCFIQLTPYHCLKNIYQRLDELILWGYYVRSVPPSAYSSPGRAVTAVKEAAAALKNGDAAAISQAYEKAFTSIYEEVNAAVSKIAQPAPMPQSKHRRL